MDDGGGLGRLTRTTAITYRHNFSKYIRGRVASTAVTVDGTTSAQSFTYDGVTGFTTASSNLGVATTYARTVSGNVDWAQDAAGRRTNFYYDWGVLEGVSSPSSAMTVTRSINADGTVAWEESTGTARTTYGYDSAGRVTSVSSATPGRVPVTTAYTIASNRLVGSVVTRGAVSVTTTIDGFGRSTLTQDSTGVQSRTTYNAVGQATYQSYPYGGTVAEVGETRTYSPFGHLQTIFRVDGSYVDFNEAGMVFQESVGPGGAYR